ncbi:hypothetical protein UFOVP150_3 [uncultured Caudovirales phage]|uniref:Uncharacterized protein n=1 Tax=uncultured Caudovirales phage TaxID=2100421 RepID=A0A6J7W7P6_9CAUD|nr:hypothetical protein UFOVP150_3 [uncultured Caudovirales phage]
MSIKRFEQSIDHLAARLSGFDQLEARVGWFPEAVYEDGTPVAEVALIQNYGAPLAGIPARPFIEPTIATNESAWRKSLAAGAKMVAKGAMTAEQVLGAVGQNAAGLLQQQIANVDSPVLSASTRAYRMRNGRNFKPLQDTGRMIASVTSVVVEKNES